jgi:hypothetical protein
MDCQTAAASSSAPAAALPTPESVDQPHLLGDGYLQLAGQPMPVASLPRRRDRRAPPGGRCQLRGTPTKE